MSQHWKLIRELWGGLDPECVIDGIPVLELLQVPRPLRRGLGTIACRRLNLSQSIGDKARARNATERMGHLSVWTDRQWTRLFTGWEVREHQARLAEIKRREIRLDEIRRSYSTSGTMLERSVLEAVLAKERESWGFHPHDRARSWRVWWEDSG